MVMVTEGEEPPMEVAAVTMFKPSFPVIEQGNHVSDPTKNCRGSVVHQGANTLHNGNIKTC
jgi:hypothetical protein